MTTKEEFRTNPRALAKEILKRIESDKEPGKSAESREDKSASGWDQATWISSKLTEENVELIPVDGGPGWADRSWITLKCPTTCCVAGWATTIAEYPPVYQSTVGSIAHLTDMIERYKDDFLDFYNCLTDSGTEHVSVLAKKLLDLNNMQADYLFDSTRSEKEVKEVLCFIAAGVRWHVVYDENTDLAFAVEE